jgi:hypothetical protein
MNKNILSLIFISSFISLSIVKSFAQNTMVDSSQVTTLRVDPGNAKGLKVSQVFEEITYIPLETTRESLFGDIDKLVVGKENFIIYDKDTQAILIFAKDGKFQAKIAVGNIVDEENKTPNAKSRFKKFDLIENVDSPSIIRVKSSKYSYEYDLKGKEVRRITLTDKNFNDRFELGNGIHATVNYYTKSGAESNYYELALLKEKEVIGKYFPFAKDWEKDGAVYTINHSNLYPRVDSTAAFFVRAGDYSVYGITNTGLSKNFRFVFPAGNSIPRDFYSNPIFKGKSVEYFDTNRDKIYSIGYPYQIGNGLFFKLATRGGLNGNDSFLYNLKTMELFSINHLQPDKTSSYLPLTDEGIGTEFANNNFHTFDGKYLYTYFSSLTMFRFKELNKGKKIDYNAVIRKYFKSGDKKGNPVILQLLPKIF